MLLLTLPPPPPTMIRQPNTTFLHLWRWSLPMPPVCNMSLSNLDLGHLVNGWPGDPVKLHPFDFNFTVEKIIKSWLAVGFLPMTGAAAFHLKVRHELGEGGAPEEAAKCLQLLCADYQRQAGILTMLGYDGAMLDLKIPMDADDSITGDDKAKINALLANNSVNRAGGCSRLEKLWQMGVLLMK